MLLSVVKCRLWVWLNWFLCSCICILSRRSSGSWDRKPCREASCGHWLSQVERNWIPHTSSIQFQLGSTTSTPPRAMSLPVCIQAVCDGPKGHTAHKNASKAWVPCRMLLWSNLSRLRADVWANSYSNSVSLQYDTAIAGSRKCELPQCMMDIRICSIR